MSLTNSTNSPNSDIECDRNPDYPLDHFAVGIPHHPMQYRAIGIIQGIYEPYENKLTKGIMTTIDNQTFQTVLLGKTISAVKNHVDLEQVQNWVIYPHGVPDTEELHFQVVGVYSEENRLKDLLPDNYFSVRGEILYSSKYHEKVVVKIRKNYPLNHHKSEYFKLELHGTIPNNLLKHFFTFAVHLEGKKLVIKNYLDLGLIGVT